MKPKKLLPQDNNASCLLTFLSITLRRPHHMDPVVIVGVSVHREFQASQEVLVPRDQQVSRDHPVIMDLKDPWAHEETRAMKELVEDRDHQVPVVTKVKMVPLLSLIHI